MVRWVGRFLAIWCVLVPGLALAQQAWVQIEARPTEPLAEIRAGEWQSRLPDVQGYRLRSGWYAIALGPYDPFRAESELQRLRALRLIPQDSFLADGTQFVAQFFPEPGALPAATGDATPPDALSAPEESVAQSRASEQALTLIGREEVQRALEWKGFYTSAIDGDFGPGTRRAMGAWQVANGFEATGVLSTAQRTGLVGDYRAALGSLGLRRVIDQTAGIEIDMPAEIVRFTRYDAPFAHFDAIDGSAAKVLLISQTGDRGTLSSLYEIMQTLEVIPPSGSRALRGDGFAITGIGSQVVSKTVVGLSGSEIKGFTVVWPADDPERFRLVAQAMEASFVPIQGAVLPETAGGDGTAQRPDLVSGLAVRRPERSRSGFYVNRDGAMLTVTEAVDGCGRVLTGDGAEALVAARDDDLGVALLRPVDPQQPLAYARLHPGAPELRSEVAVSGFSYQGVLGAPSLTFGSLEDVRGLDGDPSLRRLAMSTLEGDAGGPVLESHGTVAGMLLPTRTDGRALPEGVSFAVGSDALAAFLAGQGIATDATLSDGAPLDPVDLGARGRDMTVLVSCWAD